MDGINAIPAKSQGSGFFRTRFQMTHVNSAFQKVLAMGQDGMDFFSIYGDLFKGEPMPENRQMQSRELPGWGVELDRSRVVAIK